MAIRSEEDLPLGRDPADDFFGVRGRDDDVSLAAFGHTSGSVIAGILLFRLISCWGLVPVGWLAIALEGRRLPSWKIRLPQPAPLPLA